MLSIDVTKVKDFEEKCFETRDDGKRYMRPLTTAIGFQLALVCGIAQITPKTLDEVERRFAVIDALDPKNESVTRADLEAHLGLAVNAVPFSLAKFKANIGRIVYERATHAIEARRLAANASTNA